MTTDELLDVIKELGLRIEWEDGTPRLRGRKVPDALLPVLKFHRDEIVRRLATQRGADDKVTQELQSATTAIMEIEKASWLSPARRRLLEAMRAVIDTYHAEADPLLVGSTDWINKLVAKWRAEHEEAIRRP